MKKRLFAFIGVLVIVASVFVLPMSALTTDIDGIIGSNGVTELDAVSAVEYLDRHTFVEFSRSATVDLPLWENENKIVRRCLQASSVIVKIDDKYFYLKNIYVFFEEMIDGRCIIRSPWTTGADAWTNGATDAGSANWEMPWIEVEFFRSTPYFITRCYAIDGTGNPDVFDTYEGTEISIFLVDKSSIQDLSLNRLLNIVGFTVAGVGGGNNAWQEGFDFGYQSGETAGYNNGYDAGKTEWYQKGIDYGTDLGYDLGYDVGYDLGDIEGYDRGFGVGFNDGVKQNEEAVGMMGAMGDLITACFEAPYRLIATFLDIEIFGVNIGSTVVAIVGIMIALAVIKIVAGAKAGG